jgi:hypothetical protein
MEPRTLGPEHETNPWPWVLKAVAVVTIVVTVLLAVVTGLLLLS